MNRKLTGKWYIKRRLFGFSIMVQVAREDFEAFELCTVRYEKAQDEDLIELGINIT